MKLWHTGKKVLHDKTIKEFISYLTYEEGLAKNSIEAYRQDVTDWGSFLGEKSFEEVEPSDIIRYMGEGRRKGLSIETVLRRLSGFAQLYDFLIKEKRVRANPVGYVIKPQKWDKLPVFLNYNEVEKLLAAPDSASISGYRDSLILETIYASGMRVSEVTGVRLADVDFKRGLILVYGKGAKERYVPVYEKLLKKLDAWLSSRQNDFVRGSDPGWLFLNRRGEGLTRQYVWQMIKEYCERAGIDKDISPHTLRHSFATHLLSGGADLRTIQIFLGHENIVTTEIYTHVTDDAKRDVLSRFHPRFRGDHG